MNEQKDRQGIAVSESISAATSTVSFSSMIDVETERLTDPQRALLIEMVKRLSDGSTAIRYISKRGDAGSVDYEHCLIAVDSPDGVTQFLLTARNGEGKFMPSIFNLRFFNLISGSNGVVFYYNNVTWENFSGVTIQGPSDPSQAEAWRIAGKKYWEETGGFFDANHFNYIYYGQNYQAILLTLQKDFRSWYKYQLIMRSLSLRGQIQVYKGKFELSIDNFRFRAI
ncbi:MAG: hypothetical protein US51_C0020G0003 [Microgenomates group bacterium GW2011_GWA2_37_6]|nr:MAG: hypothetical protein US51_C0020G0003 [Microgenomates group bacterium GW2011_GWA2_37_6]